MAGGLGSASGAVRGRHAAAGSLLLLCCLACVLGRAAVAAQQQQQQLKQQQPAAPAANGTAAAANATAPDPKFPLIVVLKDPRTLVRLRLMCNGSVLMFRTFARGMGLPLDCHMPGMCRRIYSSAVMGFAGDFSSGDLRRLERCLPGAIFYKELDGTVHKAEDDGFWHTPEGEGRQQALAHALAPAGRGAVARRRLQQEYDIPRVQQFEEKVMTNSTNDTAINLWDLTQGRNMNQPGEKQQVVSSKLWNLDRLDQRDLPLNGFYSYGNTSTTGTGEGVTIYVVDSGIKLDHQEFKNDLGTRVRASYGRDFVEDDDISDDCDGHGTHVSATAAGLQVGVAKEANIVAVRILDCTGSGTISDTVAGLDWVAANHKKPAVVTLSLGIQVGSWSRVLEDAVRNLVNQNNVTVVVASGNSGVDACYVAPANVPEVITVAASNVATKYNGTAAGDREDPYKWTNSGPCIDIFAPGVDIYSACGGPSRCASVQPNSYSFASGTSMATPHVAGVAAIFLSQNPTATPAQVSAALTSTATQDKIFAARLKAGTPNRLLYSRLFQPDGSAAGAGQVVQAAGGPRP